MPSDVKKMVKQRRTGAEKAAKQRAKEDVARAKEEAAAAKK